MLIKDSLEEKEGVKSVYADNEKGIVEVDFDEKKIDRKKIVKTIQNEGYVVS